MQQRGEHNKGSDEAGADAACVRGPFLRLPGADPGMPAWLRIDSITGIEDIAEDKATGKRTCTVVRCGFHAHRVSIDADTIGLTLQQHHAEMLDQAKETLGQMKAGGHQGDVASTHDQIFDLVNAGEELARALGEHDRFTSDEDPTAAAIFCMNEAARRLALRTSLAEEWRKHEELMQAGEGILQAVGISDDEFNKAAEHGRHDHAAMVKLLGEAKKRHETTFQQALDTHEKNIALERQVNALVHLREVNDTLSRRVSELEATYQARQETVFEERRERARVAARLADALRQLPEPVQRDLEKVWAVREATEGQS